MGGPIFYHHTSNYQFSRFDDSSQNMILSCNVCSSKVDGIAYRTSCRHLLCPSCSRESFEVGCRCPVCDMKLSTADVKEVMIGIKESVEFTDNAFQYIFKGTDWIDIIENNQQVALEVANISTFLFTQLGSEVLKANDNHCSSIEKINSLKTEWVRIFIPLFYHRCVILIYCF